MTDLLIRDQLAPLSDVERADLLTDFLRNETAQRLDIDPSEIEPRGPLMNLGMSSLKAFELKLYLEDQLGFRLRSSLLFDYPTLETLVPFLLSKLDASGGVTQSESTTPDPAPEERSAKTSSDELRNVEAELARELEQAL